MAESFKTQAKPYKGKMIPCRVCEKVPNEGDEIWMQNIGTEQNQKWIASPHEECFKKLQDNPELGKKQSSNNRFTPSKFPIGQAVNVYILAEELLDLFKKKRFKENATRTDKLTIAEELQAIESFMKTLSGGFKP